MNGSTRFAVTADHIFDGRTKHRNAAVVIEGSQIISLVPRSELTTDLSIQSLPVGGKSPFLQLLGLHAWLRHNPQERQAYFDELLATDGTLEAFTDPGAYLGLVSP
jgi:hypothetical protein